MTMFNLLKNDVKTQILSSLVLSSAYVLRPIKKIPVFLMTLEKKKNSRSARKGFQNSTERSFLLEISGFVCLILFV